MRACLKHTLPIRNIIDTQYYPLTAFCTKARPNDRKTTEGLLLGRSEAPRQSVDPQVIRVAPRRTTTNRLNSTGQPNPRMANRS